MHVFIPRKLSYKKTILKDYMLYDSIHKIFLKSYTISLYIIRWNTIMISYNIEMENRLLAAGV